MFGGKSLKARTLSDAQNKVILITLLCLTETLYISLHFFPNSIYFLYNKYILTSCSCFIIYFINIKLFSTLYNSYNVKHLLIIIFSFGLIFRITLIPLPPFLSDDIYRYIWDGYIQANGINPYLYPPNSPELITLRNNIFPSINHSHLPTIYPPLSQMFFFLAYYIIGNSFINIKIVFLLFDIVTALLLVKILGKLNLPLINVAIYFLCPLPILEFFISGHIDIIGICFFILFLYFYIVSKTLLSSSSLAFAILIKLLPIIFLPIALYKLGKRKALIFLSILLFILFIFYLPHYLIVNEKIFGSFGNFVKDFYFNSSIFSLLYELTNSNQLAAIICYFALGIWLLIVALTCQDFIRGIFWTLVGFYIFSPIVHPWYLTWIVPLLIFIPNKAFFWLIMSCQLSYYVLINYHTQNLWQDLPLIRLIEYIPFFALLSYDLLRLQTKILTFRDRKPYDNKRKTS